MKDNVFSCLATHRSAIDEDYLTEALVFVANLLLERAPSAGIGLLNLLCGQTGTQPRFGSPDTVLIATQPVTELGTPDIEIRGPDTLAYVEVKHDSPLSPGQLERYKAQLDRSGYPNTRLVLLARSRYTAFDTSLSPADYHSVYWYEVYNWLSRVQAQDDISQYFVRSLMSFLEGKRMSVQKVTWEYIQGIPAMLNLTDMMERAMAAAMPGLKFTRTAGWNWRGFYLPNDCWWGVRFADPLLIVFENNKGEHPTYKVDLDLKDNHFFSLNKDEQLDCLVQFLRKADAGAPEVSQG
jgi:hypothetical protein